jgi:hypothetical protein
MHIANVTEENEMEAAHCPCCKVSVRLEVEDRHTSEDIIMTTYPFQRGLYSRTGGGGGLVCLLWLSYDIFWLCCSKKRDTAIAISQKDNLCCLLITVAARCKE